MANHLEWHDVTFLGDDSSLITPHPQRRFITPTRAAQPPAPALGLCDGARHLRHLATVATPTVVFVGDSIAVTGVHRLYTAPGLVSLMEEKFRIENPAKRFTFRNLALGGANMQNFVGFTTETIGAHPQTFVPSSYPAWWTDRTKSWIETVQDHAPDVIVIIFTSNDSANTAANTAKALISIVGKIKQWNKVPDILFCAHFARSWRSGSPDSMENEDMVAGLLRTFARANGYGFLDFHRRGCLVRDGFDQVDLPMFISKNIPALPNVSVPVPVGLQTYDYGVAINDFGKGGQAAFPDVQEMIFPLSGVQGNRLLLTFDHTHHKMYYRVDTTASITQIGETLIDGNLVYNAGGSFPNAFAIFFTLHGGTVYIDLANERDTGPVVIETVVRFGGRFDPVISIPGSTRTTLNINPPTQSGPQLFCPQVSDYDLWGPLRSSADTQPVGLDYGGDTGVHPSSIAVKMVYQPVLDAAGFRAVTT